MHPPWSVTLHRLLTASHLHPRPGLGHTSESEHLFYHNPRDNPRSTAIPTGNMWKCALGTYVFNDLLSGGPSAGTRRVVRMETLGLSGVLFYSIPPWMDLDAVFGEHGLSTEQLICGVHAKLLYVPGYACTSFVVGFVFSAVVSLKYYF